MCEFDLGVEGDVVFCGGFAETGEPVFWRRFSWAIGGGDGCVVILHLSLGREEFQHEGTKGRQEYDFVAV